MYDGAISRLGGPEVRSVGMELRGGEAKRPPNSELIDRKPIRHHGARAARAVFRKFICGRTLWNYDNLEPSRAEKLVLCAWPDGQIRQKSYVLGHSRIFNTDVINDIHTKAELGRVPDARASRCESRSRTGTADVLRGTHEHGSVMRATGEVRDTTV